jgi:hypothetical protein
MPSKKLAEAGSKWLGLLPASAGFLKMEVICSSKMSGFPQITQRYNPEENALQHD